MISVRTKRIVLGVLLAGVLAATAACTLVAKIRGAPAVESAPAEGQVAVPVSAPAPANAEFAVPPATPATTAKPAASESTGAGRASNNAEDPRAVIDWLLNRSR